MAGGVRLFVLVVIKTVIVNTKLGYFLFWCHVLMTKVFQWEFCFIRNHWNLFRNALVQKRHNGQCLVRNCVFFLSRGRLNTHEVPNWRSVLPLHTSDTCILYNIYIYVYIFVYSSILYTKNKCLVFMGMWCAFLEHTLWCPRMRISSNLYLGKKKHLVDLTVDVFSCRIQTSSKNRTSFLERHKIDVRANPDVRPWWHSLDLHTWWMLRNCWGGVGWGRDDDILWTWTHGGCYAHMVDATQLLGWGGVGMMTFFELAHMVDATQLLGWGGVGWGRDDDILWTCTHGGCYATAGVGWGRDEDILWTCTHGGCYATAGVGWGGVGSGWWHSLNLHTWWMLRNCWGGVGWGGVGMMTFFELEHMVDATQLLGWGRDDDILWTWTHGGCYAHMVDATQLLGWGGVGWGWWHSLNLHKKHGWLTGDVENASKLEEPEERTAWYEPCQEKKGPSAARAKVRVAA